MNTTNEITVKDIVQLCYIDTTIELDIGKGSYVCRNKAQLILGELYETYGNLKVTSIKPRDFNYVELTIELPDEE